MSSSEEQIEELNLLHFVAKEGGRTRIYNEERDLVLERDIITCSSFDDFKNFYSNRHVEFELVRRDAKGKERIDTKHIPLGNYWISNADRRQYKSIVFNPGKEEAEDIYNLWRGFALEPDGSGSCELYYQHLQDNVCQGNSAHYEYLLDWMANCIQFPNRQANVAIVLKGKRGGGKGSAIGYFAELFGQHHIHVFSPRQVTGNFNYHLRDAVVLFSDEAIYAGNKAEESVLKGLITEPYLPIEGKHRDLIMVRNCLHVLIATNNEWAVPAGLDERRFFVLNMLDDDNIKQNTKYFTALKNEMNSGGRAKLLHDLQQRNISKFNIYDAPKTEGLLEQKIESLNPVHSWWYQKLCEGAIFDAFGWEDFFPCEAIYNNFINSAKASGHARFQANQISFAIQLSALLPKGWPHRHFLKVNEWFEKNDLLSTTAPRKKHYEFPPLKSCRGAFEKVAGHQVAWPAEDASEKAGRAVADAKQTQKLEQL